MNLRSCLTVSAVILGLLFGVTAGWTQPDPFIQDRERLETVIIGKFSSELNLTPEQAELFFPLYHQHREQSETLMREQYHLRKSLRELSDDPSADRMAVQGYLFRQDTLQQKMAESKRQFMNEVSRFLTPQQMSRCSVLMDEIPRRVRDFIENQHRMKRMRQRRGASQDDSWIYGKQPDSRRKNDTGRQQQGGGGKGNRGRQKTQ